MIPDEQTIDALWEKYRLPPQKRIHCGVVSQVALILAQKWKECDVHIQINEQLLTAAAFLHDIDKNIEKLPGEHHPDAGVRILKEEGMSEVAEVIRTHPLHMIVDESTAPKTIEQKLLFLADKMTKQKCIGVDKRFAVWREEDTDEQSKTVLEKAYPKVKALRDEVLHCAGITEDELEKLMR